MLDVGKHHRKRRIGGLALTSWDGDSAESLVQALNAPASECIEANVMGPPLRPLREAAAGRRLGLTVTARSVYRHPVAKVFANALRARLNLSADLHERIHTALQEAMMNAMLHGNLGLDSAFRDNLQALAASYNIIKTSLATDHIARSEIRVQALWASTMLRVIVRDSGSGYKREDVPSPEENWAKGRVGSGRGLMILETMCDRIGLRCGGTTITLMFSLAGA